MESTSSDVVASSQESLDSENSKEVDLNSSNLIWKDTSFDDAEYEDEEIISSGSVELADSTWEEMVEEEEEVVDCGIVMGGQQIVPTSPALSKSKAKRKLARPSPYKNLDQNAIQAKKKKVETDLQILQKLQKEQVEHMVEQQTFFFRNTILNSKKLLAKNKEEDSSITGAASITEDVLEMVQEELTRQYNQIKYLCSLHAEESRYAKFGNTEICQPNKSKLAEDIYMSPTVKIPFKVPYRRVQEFNNEGLIKHYGYWLTKDELDTIIRYNLSPVEKRRVLDADIDGDDADQFMLIVWDKNEHLLSLDQFLRRAYMESIDDYHHVFRPKTTRKTWLAQRALMNLISFDPVAISMTSRREYVTERKYSMKVGNRKEGVPVPVEQLLAEWKEAPNAYRPKYFPPTNERIPFKSYESAVQWTSDLLAPKMKTGWKIPTLEQFKQSFERGKGDGMYSWYEEMYKLIDLYTMGDENEIQFFLSLIATASPNSGVQQNAINAMLNYRALSQGCRPKWGSYPFRSLVNFLAGTLGTPSGQKITCFLDNLLFPKTSQCVTVDTHMQNFLLGTGHQTMTSQEYVILEDFYRLMAIECGEPLPHKFQSSIWGTLAGSISFKEALKQFITPFTFQILPQSDIEFQVTDEELKAAIKLVKENISRPEVVNKATEILRKKLLDLGYLNTLPTKPESTQNGETQPTVTLLMMVPIREESRQQILSVINTRRMYARRHGRSFLPDENKEIKSAEESLEALKNSKGSVKKGKDVSWFNRDMDLIENWLLQKKVNFDELPTFNEPDPYFNSHVFFDGDKQVIPTLSLEPGNFYLKLSKEIETIASKPEMEQKENIDKNDDEIKLSPTVSETGSILESDEKLNDLSQDIKEKETKEPESVPMMDNDNLNQS